MAAAILGFPSAQDAHQVALGRPQFVRSRLSRRWTALGQQVVPEQWAPTAAAASTARRTPSSDSFRPWLLAVVPCWRCLRRSHLLRHATAATAAVEAVDALQDEQPVSKKPKRLKVSSLGAIHKWGGPALKVRQDGLALGRRAELAVDDKEKLSKWRPKRESWEGWLTDDGGLQSFGHLDVSSEVEVAVQVRRGAKIVQDWVAAVVTKIEGGQATVVLNSTGEKTEFQVDIGRGWLRRNEDARELCSDKELTEFARLRSQGRAKELRNYGLSLTTMASRSQALITLSKMGEKGLSHAERMLEALGKGKVTSTALRELAHAHARAGDAEAAFLHIGDLEEAPAALLLLECMALALTGAIVAERLRLGEDFLKGVESNEVVQSVVQTIIKTLPQLETYAAAVRKLPIPRRSGYTEAFNELLQSCGRAHAVPLAFRILEWMEALQVPKDAFTYEAIGMNTVKRVLKLAKVWDLPMAPEELCPEVVFAGRSNVGKSSLVNMLLNRNALAPTSQRPGKTKTMDFFDVNHGHPALPRFRLVDVPGLGFARVSQDMRQRWVSLIGGYFVQRKTLKIIFHLLDAGLCELMPADRELWRLLAQARRDDYELCIVLTKADNSEQMQIERFAGIVREALRKEGSNLAVRANIFACSSMTKLGKDTLWRKIWSAVGSEAAAEAVLGKGPDDPLKYRHEEFGTKLDAGHRKSKHVRNQQADRERRSSHHKSRDARSQDVRTEY